MTKVLFMKSKDLKTYCITSKKELLLNPNLKVIVSGVDNKFENFRKNWFLDINGINISYKIRVLPL
tara:strand:- start:108 stop:305 length:198 start_codon:yes stop_codon:yes gene_type:complete